MKICSDVDGVILDYIRGFIEFTQREKISYTHDPELFGVIRNFPDNFEVRDQFHAGDSLRNLKYFDGMSSIELKRNQLLLFGNRYDYFYDTTSFKINKYLPGTKIEIKKYKKLTKKEADIAFLGAWNFKEEIFKKEKLFIKNKGKFITHVPLPKII